jgi:CHAD domain-containing protein
MQPDQPVAEALRAELEPQARKLKKRLRRAEQGDQAAVHGARTTLRRLREGLALMRHTVFAETCVTAFEHALHDIERALGPTRDDDVLLADVDATMHPASREESEELASLRQWLRRTRTGHMRALAHELSRGRTRRSVRRLRRWLKGHPRGVLPPPKDPAKAAPTLVRHFLASEIWRAYEAILAYELRQPASLEVIHKVRSSCRSLRYLLETLCAALPPGAPEVIASLRALQSRLGDLHDHAVAVDRIDRAIASGELTANKSLEKYITGHRDVRDRLREEFDAEWRALTGDAFRFALSRLTLGETGLDRPASAPALVPERRSVA